MSLLNQMYMISYLMTKNSTVKAIITNEKQSPIKKGIKHQ